MPLLLLVLLVLLAHLAHLVDPEVPVCHETYGITRKFCRNVSYPVNSLFVVIYPSYLEPWHVDQEACPTSLDLFEAGFVLTLLEGAG